MKPALRITAFVEGSMGERRRDGRSWLDVLWKDDLPRVLDLRPIDHVVAFHKGQLTAMYPGSTGLARRTTSVNLPLDELMRRQLAQRSFDAAIVAFDLLPPWVGTEGPCRREETLRFYTAFSQSTRLPGHFVQLADKRRAELSARPAPAARSALPRLGQGSILAVCMEPEFESLLAGEDAVRASLEIPSGKRLANWPRDWSGSSSRLKDVIGQATSAARALEPLPRALRVTRGDIRTAPHEWGSALVRCDAPAMKRRLGSHTITRRLREVLPPP